MSTKEYFQGYYEKNKEYLKEKQKKINKALVERKREYVRELKENTPCTDCGKYYHYAIMDFDHVADDKVKGVARMLGAKDSWAKLLAEIAKCELVCANCHRMRTFNRMEKA